MNSSYNAQLTVQVIRNQHSPQFQTASYNPVSIKRNATVGTFLMQILATDSDPGVRLLHIYYRISSNSTEVVHKFTTSLW